MVMTETYCRNSCTDCMQKEDLHCAGCKKGPGRHFYGDCKVASCCSGKGYETCELCEQQESCELLQGCGQQPELRKTMTQKTEQQKKERLAERAAVLSKWLWVLFWMQIGSYLLAAVEMLPIFRNGSGQILNTAYEVVYGIILYRLFSLEARYRTAGICRIAAALLAVLLLLPNLTGSNWSLLISLPSAVLSLVGIYQELHGHADALAEINPVQSAEWKTLYKWYLICLLGSVGSLLLALLLPIFVVVAAIASVVCVIGILIVDIVKIVYLHRSVKIFRECASASQPETEPCEL